MQRPLRRRATSVRNRRGVTRARRRRNNVTPKIAALSRRPAQSTRLGAGMAAGVVAAGAGGGREGMLALGGAEGRPARAGGAPVGGMEGMGAGGLPPPRAGAGGPLGV